MMGASTSARVVLSLLLSSLIACGDGVQGPARSQGEGTETAPASPEPEQSPDVSEARLEGTFTVEVEVTKAKNVEREVGETATRVYRFTPECPEGPCDTEVEREAAGATLTELLTYSNGSYTYSDTSEEGRCADLPIRIDLSYELVVTEADTIDGEWRATAFEGEFTADFIPTAQARAAGCVRGIDVSELKGTLQE